MMRSFRWLQSRLTRTGVAVVLLGTAVGCTPTHSTINGKNAAVPPKPVFPANTTGLGASSPAFNNIQGAGAGLGNPQLSSTTATPTNRVGDPRLMSPTPGTGGAQLQQTGLNPNQQSGLTLPSVQTPPVQQAVHQQAIPQQPSINQAHYPPNSVQQNPAPQTNLQVPTQPRQFTPAPQQVPNTQSQQGNVPGTIQNAPQQSQVPLPMSMNQVPAAAPTTQTAVRQPELTPPALTEPSAPAPPAQGIQQASHSQYVLPPIAPVPTGSAPITAPSRVFADQKPNVPAPVTSAASDPNFIPPASVNPQIPSVYVPGRNR